MAFVSDDLYNEICMSNDIVDYASSYLTLKKSGRSYMACCPFHHEKTPSFHIDRDKQLFHCFGCGASGNFVQFVMRMEGLDYRDAIRFLADRAGITIPENGVRQPTELTKRKDMIYEMNRIAARFFYDNLMNSEKGREGRKYFAERRLTKGTIIKFGLGYAQDSYDSLLKYLRSRGYTDAQIIDAGLAVTRRDNVMDKFRNRVMFPIINVRGKVIGFGGRIIDSTIPPGGFKPAKYLNTPETAVFDKGSNLFALNVAKNSNETDIILCEGYMDVITLHQAGITNVVATLGTAITESQAKLMMRYGREVLICYDMDEAGTRAALRAIDIIASVGGKSRVIRIKGAKDPDEYIKKYGIKGFKEAVEKAQASTAFRLGIIKSKYNLTDTEGKIRFIDEAALILASLDNPVEVEAYIKKTASETGISEQSIFGKYTECRSKNKAKRRTAQTKDEFERREIVKINRGKPPEERVTSVMMEAEKRLLSLMASSRRLCVAAGKAIAPDEFSNDVYKTLSGQMVEYAKKGGEYEPSILLDGFSGDPEAENLAAAVFFNREVYSDNEETLYDLIYTIKKSRLDARMDTAKDPGEIVRLIKEQESLSEERQNRWGSKSTQRKETD